MVQEDVSSRASFMIHTTDNRQKAMHMSPPVQFHGGLKNRAAACPWSLTGWSTSPSHFTDVIFCYAH